MKITNKQLKQIIKEELEKITAIVLPPSKMTKKPKKKRAAEEKTRYRQAGGSLR